MVCPNWWEIIRKYDFKETINKSEYCPHSLYTKDNKNDHRKIKYFCNYISANNVNFKTRLNLTQFTFNQYKFVANRLVILSSFSTREKESFVLWFPSASFFWNKACNDMTLVMERLKHTKHAFLSGVGLWYAISIISDKLNIRDINWLNTFQENKLHYNFDKIVNF